MKVAKKYARIDQYGKMLIPLSLLERIAEECFIVDTTWEKDRNVISELKTINKVELVDGDEVKGFLMVNELTS